jgi:hypothetical protein
LAGGVGVGISGELIFEHLPDLRQVFLDALQKRLMASFFPVQTELFAPFLHLFL